MKRKVTFTSLQKQYGFDRKVETHETKKSLHSIMKLLSTLLFNDEA